MSLSLPCYDIIVRGGVCGYDAEPQHDATPSDAEADKKAKDGATHLQAAAAGEEAEKKV